MQEWDRPSDWKGKKRKKSDELCQRGIFRHMMSPNQRRFHDLLDRPDVLEAALYCSRKFGKSFSALLYEFELAMRNDLQIIRHVFPELKQGKDIVFKMFDELKQLVPRSVLPTLIKSEATLYFPQTGSSIILGGTKPENIESSRGPRAHHISFDEIASYDANNYEYALWSVLFPQLSTTGGKTPHYTTPPESPQHPWVTMHLPKLRASGNFMVFDIDQNDVLTAKAKEAILERYTTPKYPDPRKNPNFEREYLCRLIANDDLRITPEFVESLHVYSGDPYEFLKRDEGYRNDFCSYIAFDIGVVDNTAVLLGILDWRTAQLRIVKEIILKGREENYLSNFASAIRETQEEARKYSTEQLLIGDAFESVRNSLLRDHGINAQTVSKGPVEGTIGVLRDALSENKILIHESCHQLITDLTYALWKESDSETRKIARSSNCAHADSLISLAYMLKRVIWTRRPSQQKSLDFGLRRK